MIHALADVQTANIGKDTRIWQFAVILKSAKIGENCNINSHTFIENDVVIGNNVTVKSGVYLWDGMVVEDNVFIGPNATFTNDKYPRSKQYPGTFQKTILEKGSSVGANATILGGVNIGCYAIVGAGSVVTKDVPPFALVTGNPARFRAWLDEKGNKLSKISENEYVNSEGRRFQVLNSQLIEV
jgi:acetyltransferase-like isoleucine patch superfamily enzyme